MLHLFVRFEVTTISRLVITLITQVLWRLMSLQVCFKIGFCFAREFALITLEILFIWVCGHVVSHLRFCGGSTIFVVTLVALEHISYVVNFGQVSSQRKGFFRFVRTHGANYFPALVDSLVHDKFVLFQVLWESAGLKVTRTAWKLSRKFSLNHQRDYISKLEDGKRCPDDSR